MKGLQVTPTVERPEWAAIIGGAARVWLDFRNLVDLIGGPWPGQVIAVNDVAVHWPYRLEAWCTPHPEKLVSRDPDHPKALSWVQQREQNGHPPAETTYARRRPDMVDQVVEHWGGGSAGFYALPIAQHRRVTRAVLCGIGMTDTRHFSESLDHPEDKVWKHADSHWRAWERTLRKKEEEARYMRESVRSMSGRTREVLGAPDAEWLESAIREAV